MPAKVARFIELDERIVKASDISSVSIEQVRKQTNLRYEPYKEDTFYYVSIVTPFERVTIGMNTNRKAIERLYASIKSKVLSANSASLVTLD